MYTSDVKPYDTSFMHIVNLTSLETIADLHQEEPFGRWFVSDFGIYFVKPEITGITPEILYIHDFTGNVTLKVEVPNCVQRFISDSTAIHAFATISSKFIFVSCLNIITQFTRNEGTFVRQFGTHLEHSVSITSSETSVFILFDNGHVLQYDSESGNLVAEYGFTYGKLLNNVFFQFSNDFLFAPLCDQTNKVLLNCKTPVVFQWNPKRSIDKTVYSYSLVESSKTNNMTIEILKSAPSNVVNTATFSTMFSTETIRNMFQNSFITPSAYRNGEDFHLLYFSGGGDISLGTCADALLHDVKLSIKPELSKWDYKFEKYRLKEDLSSPLSDYASILVQTEDEYFFLVHGGLTCNLTTTLSTFYIVTVFTGPYGYLIASQNQIMS
jgi:hypothetical protein